MPVKHQKIDEGSVMPVMAPVIDVNWPPCVRRKKISEADGDYRWCPGVIYKDADQPADVAEAVKFLDDGL